MTENKPRFSFEISEDQRKRATKIFAEYGSMKAIMGRMLDEVMDMVEQHGYIVFGVILDSKTDVRKVIPSLNKAERVVKK